MTVVSDLMKQAFRLALRSDDLMSEANDLMNEAKALMAEAYRLDLETDFLKFNIMLEIAAREGKEGEDK